jgi:hypothetical protein
MSLGSAGKNGSEGAVETGVWKAPEDHIGTYVPDNDPVEIHVTPIGLLARESIEPSTKLQKEIEISMEPSGTRVKVSHRIANHSLFPLEYAAWAVTMMSQGGVEVGRVLGRNN